MYGNETERVYSPIGDDGDLVPFPEAKLSSEARQEMIDDLISAFPDLVHNDIPLEKSEHGLFETVNLLMSKGYAALLDWKLDIEDVLNNVEQILSSMNTNQLTHEETELITSTPPLGKPTTFATYRDAKLQIDSVFQARGRRIMTVDGIGDDVIMIPVKEEALQRLIRCPFGEGFYYLQPEGPNAPGSVEWDNETMKLLYRMPHSHNA